MYTTEELKAIVSGFNIKPGAVGVEPLGPGFINDTFIVTVDNDPTYILQRKNHIVFPDVAGMMHNIRLVTEHLGRKIAAEGGDPEKGTLTLISRKNISDPDEALYFKDDKGNWWTMTLFIKDSVTYVKADTAALAYKGGEGIGRFQTMLSDFTEPLNETIKGFHNIRWRFQQWDEAVAADKAGRVASLKEEISWIESRRAEMLDFWAMVEDGRLPRRVTHNDTKISNILFDKNGSVMCVIDLDTCMDSTSLNDFGDAIRTFTNTGDEDDRDLSRVSMSIDLFKAYTEGYLSQRKGSMTETELEWLAFGARYIVFEQVLRFLMDYIDGDTYYKIAYPEHNLVRTKAQYKLLQSIEEQYDEMKRIIKGIVG